MDEVKNTKPHKITIADRKNGNLNGVKEVLAFDPEEVVLLTEQGKLTIKGRQMHVGKLDVDKGELELTGIIDSMVYTDVKTPGQVTSGIIGRLFK